jgi:pyruvate formate lyase activating enzyme
VDKIELLPFKKMCEHKYENMGIPFPLKDIPEPSPEKIRELEEILKQK